MESRRAENAEAEAARANAEVNARRNPKSESYGFALYIFASVLWVVWVLWAASPEWLLIQLGIEWFPHRDWAYLLISWSLVLVLMTYIVFMSINVFMTPPLDSLDVVTDPHAILYPVEPAHAVEDRHPLSGLSIPETGQPGAPLCDDIYDLSPGLVSRALYLQIQDKEHQ